MGEPNGGSYAGQAVQASGPPAERIACRYLLHILDTNPMSASANGWLEDTSKVQKYVMSDDAYSQREGTYRQYKQMRRKVCPLATLPACEGHRVGTSHSHDA